MLKFVRKHLKFFLWTMIACFVLWAVGNALSTRQSESIYAGTVYGKPVSVTEFRSALEAATRRALLTYGEQARQLMPYLQLEKQAWDMILLQKAAQRARVRVNDREVVDELARWPIFQKEGQFDTKTYEMIVRYSLGTTPRAFEEEVRSQLAVTKLMDKTSGDQPISEEELLSAYRMEWDTVKLAYMIIDSASFAQQASVVDKEIQSYYEQHREEFQSEPTLEVEYLLVPPSSYESQVEIPEGGAAEDRARLARDKAADVAWELRSQWKPGTDLATLGQAHGLSSKKPRPFSSGDTLEEIPSFQAFSTAAFSLKADEISHVIETPEGFYLLRLLKQNFSQPLPFEAAHPRIRQKLQEQQAVQLAREAAQNWYASVQEKHLEGHADPLAEVAKQSGFEVKRTDWVRRTNVLENNVGVGKLLGPAFRLEVGDVGGPWPTSQGWVIAQLLEKKPFDKDQFEKAKEEIKTGLLERKRSAQMESYLNKIRTEAQVKPNPKFMPKNPAQP